MSAKRNNIIKFLSTISLLIFFLPFFQTCSDKNIKKESGFLKTYQNAKTEKEKEIAFHQAKKKFSLNGYELAMSFEPIFLGFTAMMVVNFTICIATIRGYKKLLLLSLLNLVLILFSFIIFIFALIDLGQIRYGMYVFTANAISLFYFIYKNQELN